MKINKITNCIFKSNSGLDEKRLLPPNTKENAQKLLWEMNHQTTYCFNKDKTEVLSNILNSINIKDNIKFSDNRFYPVPVEQPKKHACDCTLQIGKTILNINSSTGEIVSYKKGFFTTWSSIYKKVEKFITFALENFNNSNVIKKNFLPTKNFTANGIEMAIKYFYKLK